MKRIILTMLAVLAVGATQVANALSLTLTDGYYVGKIVDGVPPADNELNWVNELITLAPGTTAPSANPSGETLTRSLNVLGYPNMPIATSAEKEDPALVTWVVPSQALYLLGKYGKGTDSPEGIQASYVWYVAGLVGETVSLPAGALSHDVLMKGSVPDGGTAAAMLGIAFLGLGIVARRSATRS